MNLDRIKAQCEWSEEEQAWTLPKMKIEQTKLPPTGIHPGGRDHSRSPAGAYPADPNDYGSDDRLLQVRGC